MILFKVHFYLLEYLKSFQCMTWILEKNKAHLYTLNISMICEKYSHNSNLHPRFPQFMNMLETSLSFYNRNLMGLHLLCKHRLDKLISVTRSNPSIFLDMTMVLPRQLTYLDKNAGWTNILFLKWHLFPRRNRSFSGEGVTWKFVQTCGERSVFIINWGTMMANAP